MKGSINVWIVAEAPCATEEIEPCLRALGHPASLIMPSVDEALQAALQVSPGPGAPDGDEALPEPALVIVDLELVLRNGEDEGLRALSRQLRGSVLYLVRDVDMLEQRPLRHGMRWGDITCVLEPGELALAIPLALGRCRRNGVRAHEMRGGDELGRAAAPSVITDGIAHDASIFHLAAIPLWEDDISRIVEALGELRTRGVTSFRSYFAENPEQVFELVSKTRIIAANSATLAFFGVASCDELRSSLGRMFIPDSLPGLMDILVALAHNKGEHEGELVLCNSQGKRLTALFRVTFLGHRGEPDTQQPERMLLSCLDITERKRAEEQIRRLNADLRRRAAELRAANAELESFSYSVSHDLRAPLRAMNGFSQALIEDYSGAMDAQGKSYLQRIRRASLRMAQLIDALLDLSRMSRSAMHIETCNLSTMAEAIVAELRKTQPEREVEVSIQPDIVVDGDRSLLRVVLENLLGNAWKFSSRKPAARIELVTTWHEHRPAYLVRDNGAGFDMVYMTKLFKPFQRLHDAQEFEGTGVGLATVKRIIHRHGGDIWAEGKVGEGAAFTFTLG